MAGFGVAPFGSSPYGLGTPATTAADNSGVVLADDLGVQHGSRYINPRTRQYEYDAHGRAKGMPNVRQLAMLAFLTIEGSSAMADLGIEEASGVIGVNFVARRKEAIQRAFARLTRDKLLTITSIEVDITRRPTFTLVRWKDLTTEIEHEDSI